MFVSHSLAQISQSEAGINYPPFSLDKLLIKNGHTFGLRAVTIPQGTHTMCVCVTDCYFIVNVLDLSFASPMTIHR